MCIYRSEFRAVVVVVVFVFAFVWLVVAAGGGVGAAGGCRGDATASGAARPVPVCADIIA